jgi:UDP-2,3-diacylglucosamine pyrophosphatase LpxH
MARSVSTPARDRTLAQKYYFVSDLYMGGDGQLQHCDYAAELIAFLKGLESETSDTELLIVGDTFGFWN